MSKYHPHLTMLSAKHMLGTLLMILVAAYPALAQTHRPDGIWVGNLDMGAITFRMVLTVKLRPDGTYVATVDSPDQGAFGMKAEGFAVNGDQVTFTSVGAKYVGKFSKNGKEIVGDLVQGPADFPVTLKHRDKPLDYSRPQDPKPPFPYRSEDVVYTNAAQGNKLAGTLTLPAGAGPFPAALLITGSGPQNRNEEILGHRPFWVIADYLTRRGIAVLRVDDRGVGASTGNPATATTADFETDVLTGVGYLKGRPEIDPKRIGLIGHSEGGIIAPMAASQSEDIAFIVMMAGTGMPGADLLPLQAAAIMKASGATPSQIAMAVDAQRKMFAIMASSQDSTAKRTQLRKVYDAALAAQPEEARKHVKNPDVSFAMATAPLTSPWFQYFLTLDPVPYLKKVKCPVLAINGSLDTQVPAKENLPLIAAALKRGGNRHAVVKELPGLNHLFQRAKTGAPSEYAEINETIWLGALKIMGDWIVATVHGGR